MIIASLFFLYFLIYLFPGTERLEQKFADCSKPEDMWQEQSSGFELDFVCLSMYNLELVLEEIYTSQ